MVDKIRGGSRFPLGEGMKPHDGGQNPFLPPDGVEDHVGLAKEKVYIQLRGYEPLFRFSYDADTLRWEWGRTPSPGDIVGYVRAYDKDK